jgi:hypothetical protein
MTFNEGFPNCVLTLRAPFLLRTDAVVCTVPSSKALHCDVCV